MIITVENRVVVSADVTVEQVEAYLMRRGWTSGRPSWGTRPWKLRVTTVMVPENDDMPDAGLDLTECIYEIASHEERQPHDILADIVGRPAGDRGRLINRKATAGARVVEAREAVAKAKARGIVEQERARVRLLQAEAEYESAERELAAVEGR